MSTPGPWLGIRRDIRDSAVDNVATLKDGDIMVLFTDGLIEAMNAEGEQFDMHRLCFMIEQHRHESPATMEGRLMAAVRDWMVTLPVVLIHSSKPMLGLVRIVYEARLSLEVYVRGTHVTTLARIAM